MQNVSSTYNLNCNSDVHSHLKELQMNEKIIIGFGVIFLRAQWLSNVP